MSRILTSVLVIFLLVLTGCSGTQSDQEGDITYKRGTQAVEMNFMDGSPPITAYHGDVIDVGIELWNKGTSAVPQGVMFLSGFDSSIISPTIRTLRPTQTARPDIVPIPTGEGIPFDFTDEQKRTQYNEEGGYKTFVFTGSVNLPQDTGRLTVPLKVDTCYLYSTDAVLSVCLDPMPYRNDIEKACNSRTVNGLGGQGAPISITNVETEPTQGGLKSRFKITISNSGSGTVLDQRVAIQNCPNYFYPVDINKVHLKQITLGSRPLTCEPSTGIINLGNSGTGYIYCEGDIEQDSAYVTTLTMRLEYGYKNSMMKNIELKRI